MIRAIEATAPGKLILLGEYAVLFGAPAAVLAVQRRARVRLTPSEDRAWHVRAPGLAPGEARLRIEPGGGISWEKAEDARRLGLLELLLRGLHDMGILEPSKLPPLEVLLDTRQFFQEGVPGRPKLGLGSSAALIVATATALVAWAQGGDAAEVDTSWLAELVELHRRIQGGMGSGADVAASLLGGTLRYQLHGEARRPEASPVRPPTGIQLRFIWTGRPASTGDYLERLHRALEDHPTTTGRHLEALGELSDTGIAQLEADDGEAFLETVESFWHALDRLGRCLGLPILSPEHVKLHELASRAGVRYKPSGAGGGDFGIAFGERPEPLEHFVRLAAAGGYHPLQLEVAKEGVVSSANA
ncbi:MAG: hypothetical protein GXP47_01985 [Acidobacteria bacterium]|nr:hypothetical protein [Acidobacteriota bacterium]